MQKLFNMINKLEFTTKQLKDLETIEYYAPSWGEMKNIEITDQDRKDYLLFSERGITPKVKTKGYEKLEWGKKWRGIMIHEVIFPWHCDEFGGFSWYEFIQDHPISVIDFIKKEIPCRSICGPIIDKCLEDLVRQEILL